MMRSEGLRSARGIVAALILIVAAAFVGFLCFRAAAVRTLPASSPGIAQIAGHDPDVVLDEATTALVKQHGILDPAMLDRVRRAAQAAPLDARAYLVLGHQQILDREPQRAVLTLERGQRLDPREQLIHLLLADRYLRTARFADAAAQFAVMARLGSEGPIAPAMAQMSVAPDTRDAVRRVLSEDPQLERDVLFKLAGSNVAPATIFAIASPTARRNAGAKDGWGGTLVSRLVAHGQFAEARRVWQHVYGLSDAAIAAPLFNPGFQKLAATPPFNWLLTADSLGAADPRGGSLSIDYYGRDNGELASQLLVLAPGPYRFAFTVDGTKTNGGPNLVWSLRCASGATTDLMRVTATGSGAPRRVVSGFTVPSGCPAQRLVLTGEAGDFPATVTVTLRDLALQPATGARS